MKLHPEIYAALLRRNKSEEWIRSLTKDNDLFNPLLLKGMKKSVYRIMSALEEKEKITIFGDYDVDGCMATLILVDFLKSVGANVDYYIPDRTEGYGLSMENIGYLINEGTKLLISVDTGITAVDEINYAENQGMNVIITDHHLLSDQIPNAYAIINPLQDGCKSPFKKLSGAGISFYLIRALRALLVKQKYTVPSLMDYIVFAMISTVADVVPLVKDNRTIVKEGLKALYKNNNIALQEILRVKNFYNAPSSQDIAFQIAPLINAAGRMESAKIILELFLESDETKVKEKVTNLFKLNDDRKILTKDFKNKYEEKARNTKDKILVIASEKIPEGLTGVLAAKFSELSHRPCLVISFENSKTIGKGSARSFGIDIKKILDESSDLFLKFGGHPEAAGFSIQKKNIDKLKKNFDQVSLIDFRNDNQTLEKDIDFSEDFLTEEFMNSVELLEPFGKELEPLKMEVEINSADFSLRVLKDEHYLLTHNTLPLKILIFYFKEHHQDLINQKFSVIGNISKERSQLKLLTEKVKIK